MATKTSGIIPKKPVADFVTIALIIPVVSFIAVGENSKNTPILQINMKRIYGMILNRIDGMLKKYL